MHVASTHAGNLRACRKLPTPDGDKSKVIPSPGSPTHTPYEQRHFALADPSVPGRCHRVHHSPGGPGNINRKGNRDIEQT